MMPALRGRSRHNSAFGELTRQIRPRVDTLTLPVYAQVMAKHFTLDQANALLPELRTILAELERAIYELDAAEAEVDAADARVRGNGHGPPSEPYARRVAAREAVARLIERIGELGCELKDPRSGLIDFPSRRDGQEIYLCWKLDEHAVLFWHPIDTGFAGRQPL